MTNQEIEILILENALDSAKIHTARMMRRLNQAIEAHDAARGSEIALKWNIKQLREAYLRGVV